jgi:choline dehydrogenase-like flavoprotein
MLSSANDLEDGARLVADVCIVGAGAAGITLALELIDSGLQVCVLAGGGLELARAEQELYQGTMSGLDGFTLDARRVRAFGGTTHWWAGWCRPLAVEDFEARDYIPHSGWPIDFEQLAPFYERAHRTLELGAFNYDLELILTRAERSWLQLEGSAVRSELFQFSPPTRMGSTYRSQIEEAANVRALADGHMLDLEADGRRVVRLSCGTLAGKRFTVEAGRFVLAMGALENARMLLAADDGRGVANGSDAVGRYFMEHPHYRSSVKVVSPEGIDTTSYARFAADTRVSDDHPEAPIDVVAVLALSAEAREREGLPTWNATLVDADGDLGEADAQHEGAIGPLGVAELLRPQKSAKLWTLTCRVEQAPDPDSRVTLIDERDAFGIPRIDLHWKIRERDNEALVRSLELLGADLARNRMGRLYVPTSAGRFDFPRGSGCHHMGTTRMANDPEHGVVDADCLCFDLDNLYLAGSSVFATSGASNPTLTIVALAHRLADHLKGLA